MKPRVFIVGMNIDCINMFEKKNWEIVKDIKKADLVQFIGGEDVSPQLCGQARHQRTFSNPLRDSREEIIFNIALSKRIPMAGICRGAQFLNIMCGGDIYQHVNGHKSPHLVKHDWTGDTIEVNSTHHQMMIPSIKGWTLLSANTSSRREKQYDGGPLITKIKNNNWDDPECIWYMEKDVLCFQPHPEASEYEYLADYYFEIMKETILGK